MRITTSSLQVHCIRHLFGAQAFHSCRCELPLQSCSCLSIECVDSPPAYHSNVTSFFPGSIQPCNHDKAISWPYPSVRAIWRCLSQQISQTFESPRWSSVGITESKLLLLDSRTYVRHYNHYLGLAQATSAASNIGTLRWTMSLLKESIYYKITWQDGQTHQEPLGKVDHYHSFSLYAP